MNNNLENEENPEPQITSDNPEERKLARALRIQRRIEAIKKQHELEDHVCEVEIEKSLLEKQIETSAELLEQLLVEGEEVVTNVRVGNDAREVNRREKEAAKRVFILEQLQNEAQQAEEIYQQISDKWNEISVYKDPLDIHESIAEQKIKCDELIKQKDEIIAMLREEIDQAEIKFTMDQEVQNDDIKTLVKRIDNQVDLMRKSYRNELKLIEEAIASERQMLIEANNKKWDVLHKQRNESEEDNTVKKINMADKFLVDFNETRIKHEEKFRETKIALECETETLQKELEILKAACLLNGEKLDYNYHILKRREEENIIIRSQQKRLINKLQDEINKIRRSTNQYKKESEENIAKLTEEIKKMRNSVFQIEAKSDHIAQVNDTQYHEVWTYNEDTVLTLLDKILTTDRIIHEQLLGLEWKNPNKPMFKKQQLSSYKEAVEILGLKAQREKNMLRFKPNEPIDDSEFPKKFIDAVLSKISYRSDFLIENRLKTLLPDLQDNEQHLTKIDNVFNALGVRTKPEFNFLLEFFKPYARCPVCEQKEIMDQSSIQSAAEPLEIQSGSSYEAQPVIPDVLKAVGETANVINEIVVNEIKDLPERNDMSEDLEDISLDDDSSETQDKSGIIADTMSYTNYSRVIFAQSPVNVLCKFDHPMVIDAANVFRALKDFVTAFNYVPKETPTMNERLARKRNTISRLISDDDVKIFWGQFNNVFTKVHDETWNSLLFGLKKYYAILNDRHEVYDELLHLRKENKELLYLLKKCTGDITRKKGELHGKKRSKKRIWHSSRSSTASSVSSSEKRL